MGRDRDSDAAEYPALTMGWDGELAEALASAAAQAFPDPSNSPLKTKSSSSKGNQSMSPRRRHSRIRGMLLNVALFAAPFGAVAGIAATSRSAEEPRLVPAPQRDVAGGGRSQSAVFAGGCFWGIQAVFQHVKGVTSATAGYAGGSAATATYEQTESVESGRAEAVRIDFDPSKVTYGELLQVFFSVAHDPTQKNRQGPDVGWQYRSAIFPQSDEQARVARAYIAQLESVHSFKSAMTTTIEADKPFCRAEGYHQNYVFNNPAQPYIQIYELPKISSLKSIFPGLYREKPVLVSQAG